MNQFNPMNNPNFPNMNSPPMFGMNNPNFNPQYNPQMNFQNMQNRNANFHNPNISIKFNFIDEKTEKSQIINIQCTEDTTLQKLIESFENKIGRKNSGIKYYFNNEKLDLNSIITIKQKGLTENSIIVALGK